MKFQQGLQPVRELGAYTILKAERWKPVDNYISETPVQNHGKVLDFWFFIGVNETGRRLANERGILKFETAEAAEKFVRQLPVKKN